MSLSSSDVDPIRVREMVIGVGFDYNPMVFAADESGSSCESTGATPPRSPPYKRHCPSNSATLDRTNASPTRSCTPSCDNSDAFPPSSPTPPPPNKHLQRPLSRSNFATEEDLRQFLADHAKDLSREDHCDLAWSIMGIPKRDKNRPRLILRCGELALAHFKEKHKDDYEYASDMVLSWAGNSIHLNFYARPKGSKSRPNSGRGVLFFADMESEDKVKDCCIIDAETLEIQSKCCDTEVIHPLNMNCTECEQLSYYI